MGSSPIPTPSSPTYVPYVPSFPFYDAEPYWPKGGYGHHGGEGGSGDGSGGAATTDFYIFVDSFDTAAPKLTIGEEESEEDIQLLEYEPMTIEALDEKLGKTVTYHCYHYKNCPVGAEIHNASTLPAPLPALFYNGFLEPSVRSGLMGTIPLYCPRPLDGLYIVGGLSTGLPPIS